MNKMHKWFLSLFIRFPKQHIYFVSFKFIGGFGNIEVKCEGKIESMTDIRTIEVIITEKNENKIEGVHVDNWKELKK